MPVQPPADAKAVLSLLRQSGLVTESRLCRFLAARPEVLATEPEDLLCALVEDALLTPFQASQIEMGRWRGLVLKQYEVLDSLGGGGMGQVFLGRHNTLGRRVAIKVLAGRLADDVVARARLVREARAATALDHPNIVRVYDVDTDHSPPFLVMEYLEGLSLQAAVALGGTFPATAVALCGRQVANALQHASDIGIVHRDVKPANLVLDRQGQVKLLDLGIVRSVDTPGLTLTANRGKMILGTLDYLAPEQADDCSNVDCRADIYSLGATLYFLLAGHPPFPEGTSAMRLAAKRNQDPVPIHTLRPDIPLGLSEVIHRMLARRTADRYTLPQHASDALAPWAIPTPGFPEQVFDRPGEIASTPGTRTTPPAENRARAYASTACTQCEEPIPEQTVAMSEEKLVSFRETPSPPVLTRDGKVETAALSSQAIREPIVTLSDAFVRASSRQASCGRGIVVGFTLLLVTLVAVILRSVPAH